MSGMDAMCRCKHLNRSDDVRKDLKTPKLPCVIGELTGVWVEAPPEFEAIRKSEETVAARKEFKGPSVLRGLATLFETPRIPQIPDMDIMSLETRKLSF